MAFTKKSLSRQAAPARLRATGISVRRSCSRGKSTSRPQRHSPCSRNVQQRPCRLTEISDVSRSFPKHENDSVDVGHVDADDYKRQRTFFSEGGKLNHRLRALLADDANIIVKTALGDSRINQQYGGRSTDKGFQHHHEACERAMSDILALQPENEESPSAGSTRTLDVLDGADGLDGLASVATQDLPSLRLSQSSDGVDMLLAASDYNWQNLHRDR